MAGIILNIMNIDLKKITATNMRELVERNKLSLRNILKKIEIEATLNKKNHLSLTDFRISDVDKKELESRGFIVDIGGRYNEVDTYIKW